jgi:hypothetical protein
MNQNKRNFGEHAHNFAKAQATYQSIARPEIHLVFRADVGPVCAIALVARTVLVRSECTVMSFSFEQLAAYHTTKDVSRP